ncbi:MAG: hypothetical protein Q9M36_11655 [Sulfurovum sp.]|nr:hypothetical protein [Sulfurovum sp.]
MTTYGLETIDEDVISAYVYASEGQKFNAELIKETSNKLYSLGSFDSILIDTDKKLYNVIPVEITFKEREKPYHFEIGAGYDTYVGARIHSTITKHNFLGNAQKITLKAGWSEKEQVLISEYFNPLLLRLGERSVDFGIKGGIF